MNLRPFQALTLAASLLGCAGAQPAGARGDVPPTTAALAGQYRALAATPSCDEPPKPERRAVPHMLGGGMCTE